MSKVLLLVLDGLADRPNGSLSGMTCLEKAKTPFLDRFAREGACGLVRPFFKKGSFPTSEDTHFTLFGYDANEYQVGRGVFEALGMDIDLKPEDVAWRGNWTTLDEAGRIVDRRAGRLPATRELIAGIEELTIENVNFHLYPGKDHRSVLVLRGEGLSSKLSDGYRREAGVLPLLISPLDKSKEAEFTARITNIYLKKVKSILKDNPVNIRRARQGLQTADYILLRGSGRLTDIPPFEDKFGWSAACVAAGHLYRGIAKSLGFQIINVPGADATPETNLIGKIDASLQALTQKDFVFCHIKATDILSHDHDCLGKVGFLERIDQSLRDVFKTSDLTLIVTGDHATPCELGEHSEDLIPILVWGDKVQRDMVSRFGESFCANGSLGVMDQADVLRKIKRMIE